MPVTAAIKEGSACLSLPLLRKGHRACHYCHRGRAVVPATLSPSPPGRKRRPRGRLGRRGTPSQPAITMINNLMLLELNILCGTKSVTLRLTNVTTEHAALPGPCGHLACCVLAQRPCRASMCRSPYPPQLCHVSTTTTEHPDNDNETFDQHLVFRHIVGGMEV
jgi:hypothetical protein